MQAHYSYMPKDVVHDSDMPRGFWKVGRVMKLITGKNDQVRGAVLRVVARGEQATMLRQPLQLCIL